MPTFPFPDSPDLPVVILKRIIEGKSHILTVVHPEPDTWFFLDEQEWSEQDGGVATLAEVVERFPDMIHAAMLPIGFAASRETPDSPWELFITDEE